MKPYLHLALTVFALYTGSPALAASPVHDHAQGATELTLQLNAGKKWQTDAPLRAGMLAIRQSMADSLHAIHENKLSARSYDRLAKQVRASVAQIVATCKLPPAADAQLHIVIADLLAGADQMAGQVKGTPRMDGAVKVIGALKAYGQHFDHPGFQPIEH
ncbi:MAG TPA: hypothetical protein VFW84_03270 [Aquabacterium sp.]|uniref:hypothetical protein n=1 Tax=Aquabacterium sp. TaxID=1872578 RepID=UPI002E34F42F|nr:hypothetical protein [Aquabacterium sp.]HEX5371735.1 hypothetical protein [Aquabacterium sp.]